MLKTSTTRISISSFDRSFIYLLIYHFSRTALYSATALKVEFNGDFRICCCLDCCKRWYFTFNGVECKSPLAIGGLQHIGMNHHWHRPQKYLVRTHKNEQIVISFTSMFQLFLLDYVITSMYVCIVCIYEYLDS